MKTSQVLGGAGLTPEAGVTQGLALEADIPGRAEAGVVAVKAAIRRAGLDPGQVPTPAARAAVAVRAAAAVRRRKAGAPAKTTRAAVAAAALTRAAVRVKTTPRTSSKTTTAPAKPRATAPAAMTVKVGAGARRGEQRRRGEGA